MSKDKKRLTESPVYNTRMGWYQVSMMDETITDKDGYDLGYNLNQNKDDEDHLNDCGDANEY